MLLVITLSEAYSTSKSVNVKHIPKRRLLGASLLTKEAICSKQLSLSASVLTRYLTTHFEKLCFSLESLIAHSKLLIVLFMAKKLRYVTRNWISFMSVSTNLTEFFQLENNLSYTLWLVLFVMAGLGYFLTNSPINGYCDVNVKNVEKKQIESFVNQ